MPAGKRQDAPEPYMTNDDIIRRFLDLHPDTPIDMKEYAIPLRIISRMLEAGAAAERKRFCSDLRGLHDVYSLQSVSTIRAKGQT